ncbi:MAG: hypothetical protein U0822_08125 [Anaerolineae bacterium]
MLGLAALAEGNVDEAHALFEQLLSEEEATLNRPMYRGWAHYALGSYYLRVGDPTQARAQFETALALFDPRTHHVPRIDTQAKLGLAEVRQGDLRRAASKLRDNLDTARSASYRWAVAKALFSMAGLALAANDLPRAARWFGAAEALSELTGGLDGDQQYLIEQDIAVLRERLDPPALARYWAEGRVLDWQRAVDEAVAFAASVEANSNAVPTA